MIMMMDDQADRSQGAKGITLKYFMLREADAAKFGVGLGQHLDPPKDDRA